MKKRYYSSNKEYSRVKKPFIIYRLVSLLFKKRFSKVEFEWRTEKPTEAVVFCSNHTKLFAPQCFQYNSDLDCRLWANGAMVEYKRGIKLVFHKLAYEFPKWLKIIIVPIGMPIVNAFIRGMSIIPVNHGMSIKITFKKTNETLIEGKHVVIFADINKEPVRKYVNEMQTGFVHLAKEYYKETGKAVSFYPVYTSESLGKVIIGEPIKYDIDISLKEQRDLIVDYLNSEQEKLAESLGEHEPVFAKVYPDEIVDLYF